MQTMADEHVTKEQLEAIAAENEEGEKVFYKPPAQKTLQEIQDLDQDDESLRKYKETLLGSGGAAAGMSFSSTLATATAVTGVSYITFRQLAVHRFHPIRRLQSKTTSGRSVEEL